MPKYNVETTVIYRFQIEAESKMEAQVKGFDFDEYQWVLEIADVVVEKVDDK